MFFGLGLTLRLYLDWSSLLAREATTGSAIVLTLYEWLASPKTPVSFLIHLDGLSLAFTLITLLTGAIYLAYAWISGDQSRPSLIPSLGLIGFALLTVLLGDLVLVYVSWEAMGLIGLLGLAREREIASSGRRGPILALSYLSGLGFLVAALSIGLGNDGVFAYAAISPDMVTTPILFLGILAIFGRLFASRMAASTDEVIPTSSAAIPTASLASILSRAVSYYLLARLLILTGGNIADGLLDILPALCAFGLIVAGGFALSKTGVARLPSGLLMLDLGLVLISLIVGGRYGLYALLFLGFSSAVSLLPLLATRKAAGEGEFLPRLMTLFGLSALADLPPFASYVGITLLASGAIVGGFWPILPLILLSVVLAIRALILNAGIATGLALSGQTIPSAADEPAERQGPARPLSIPLVLLLVLPLVVFGLLSQARFGLAWPLSSLLPEADPTGGFGSFPEGSIVSYALVPIAALFGAVLGSVGLAKVGQVRRRARSLSAIESGINIDNLSMRDPRSRRSGMANGVDSLAKMILSICHTLTFAATARVGSVVSLFLLYIVAFVALVFGPATVPSSPNTLISSISLGAIVFAPAVCLLIGNWRGVITTLLLYIFALAIAQSLVVGPTIGLVKLGFWLVALIVALPDALGRLLPSDSDDDDQSVGLQSDIDLPEREAIARRSLGIIISLGGIVLALGLAYLLARLSPLGGPISQSITIYWLFAFGLVCLARAETTRRQGIAIFFVAGGLDLALAARPGLLDPLPVSLAAGLLLLLLARSIAASSRLAGELKTAAPFADARLLLAALRDLRPALPRREGRIASATRPGTKDTEDDDDYLDPLADIRDSAENDYPDDWRDDSEGDDPKGDDSRRRGSDD